MVREIASEGGDAEKGSNVSMEARGNIYRKLCIESPSPRLASLTLLGGRISMCTLSQAVDSF